MVYSDITFNKGCVKIGNTLDCVYSFNIDSRYKGHTRDYNRFWVYDQINNTYEIYNKSEFENFLQNKNGGNNNGAPYLQYSGLPKYDIGGFNAAPLIIGAAFIFIIFLFFQK